MTDRTRTNAPSTLPIMARLAARRRERRRARAATSVPPLDTTEELVPTSFGPVAVRTIGDGPPVLFVHGLLVDGHVWDGVVAELASDFRCILPTLPLGSHHHPLARDADRSPAGMARLLNELCEVLQLADVTVVANDSGGAITQIWMADGAPHVARVVLTPVDCFDRFPPPAFRVYLHAARSRQLTRLLLLGARRLRALRHTPITYGGLTHRPIDDALAASWLAGPAAASGVVDDVCGFLRGIARTDLSVVAGRLAAFDRPVLLAWSCEQAWFPVEHAVRLRAILPRSEIALITGSGAFPQLDQPAALARLVDEFAAAERSSAPALGAT